MNRPLAIAWFAVVACGGGAPSEARVVPVAGPSVAPEDVVAHYPIVWSRALPPAFHVRS
jgi:hypothetical protein